MKKLSIILSFLFVATMAMAQQNLREGYVITLQGDTLHGMIDYRTSAMNTKRCVFKENGATEFKTYLPGEIDSYRFTNNGIYYVSKNVANEAGTREMVFAEYVLRGSMNLYQIGSDRMLLVNEDGNEATFSLDRARNATGYDEMRDEMRDVIAMLGKSEKASAILWKQSKNRDNTKKAVMTYVDDVCKDGTCEAFEYKSKSTPKEDRVLHPWVKAGFKATQYKFWNDKTITGYAPQFSVGADLHINQLLKGLMVNIGLAYEPGKASIERQETEEYREELRKSIEMPLAVDFNQFDIMIGPGYQFKTGALKTRVKCGGIYRLASHNFDYTYQQYFVPKGETEWRFDAQFGLYAGAGLEYPLKKCSLICDLEYIYDYNKWTKYAEPDRTVAYQNALCLSVGVKF